MSTLPLGFALLLTGGVLVATAALDASGNPLPVLEGQDHGFAPFKGSSAATAAPSTTSADTGAPSSATAPLIMSYLERNGFSAVAAAGVVGNLQQESNLNPQASGGGLGQWIGERWTALVSYVQGLGLDPNSAEGQLAFLVHEVTTQYPAMLAQMNAASTPAEAATIFSEQYERPGLPMLSNRQNYAEQAYQQAGGN